MQKVIVTGSSGRIGSEIVLALKPSYEVIGIDRVAAPTTAHIADISDAKTMQHLCQGAFAVIHSAALHAPHVGVFSEDEFRRINVKGTVALAHMARAKVFSVSFSPAPQLFTVRPTRLQTKQPGSQSR
ncbi:NAD dependent epimerase/dehydratase family protein [Pseudovibrio sp. Ad46]|nr:NAD dependent epimerase/dehydratase family protein [Pseudovibrio sp. Ad46]